MSDPKLQGLVRRPAPPGPPPSGDRREDDADTNVVRRGIEDSLSLESGEAGPDFDMDLDEVPTVVTGRPPSEALVASEPVLARPAAAAAPPRSGASEPVLARPGPALTPTGTVVAEPVLARPGRARLTDETEEADDLASAPARRLPAIAGLRAAIARVPRPLLRRVAIGVGAFVLLLTLGLLVRRQFGSTCGEAEGELAGVWDGARREALRGAITATGLPHAESTWERLAARLDAHAEVWREARRGACVAQEDAPAPGLDERRAACLQDRRSALKALVDTLVVSDAKALERAIPAALALPTATPCGDLVGLAAASPPPGDPRVAAEVASLRERLAAARVALALRRSGEGLAIVGPILARAHELGYLPLEAEAVGVVGELQREGGDLAAAEARLTDAVWLSDQVRDDTLLAEHMAALIILLGQHLGRPDEALRWRRHADSVRARLPAAARGQARLLLAIGVALRGGAQLDEALGTLKAALTRAEESFADAERSPFLVALAEAHRLKGDPAAARALLERALALDEAALGPEHPQVAEVLVHLGAVAVDLDASLAHLRRALAIQEAARGAEHVEVAATLRSLGAALSAKGDRAAARTSLERALAIQEKSLGADDPRLADVLYELGVVAGELGDAAAARVFHERALGLREKSLAADDPRLVASLAAVADLGEGDEVGEAPVVRAPKGKAKKKKKPKPKPKKKKKK